MSESCRVLLICDDDLGGLELRGILGKELRIDPVLAQGPVRTLTIEIDEVVLNGTWEMGIRDRHYHLCIVAVSSASPVAELARHPLLRGNLATVLYLVESGTTVPTNGVMRPDRDRMLEMPCSRTTLLQSVERLLLSALSLGAAASAQTHGLALVRALVENQQRQIPPLLTIDDPHGWRYPLVLRHAGLGIDQGALLERLVEHGLCTRTIAHRVRACPACQSHQLAYGEVCARCSSVDFVRETIIHHFPCAHMDTMQNFRRSTELVCPKCHAALRQIGRDYEKPTDCYLCRSCAFISAETSIQARCLACQKQVTPEQTVERLIYTYELTAKADAAVAANDLAGPEMAGVLRNHKTGVFTRDFFLFSLRRELERKRRYSTPVSLVMVRSNRLAEVRSDGGDRFGEYVETMWKAATDGLRTLDVACVYEEGVLAIMLTATPLAGAEVVSERIAERFRIATSATTTLAAADVAHQEGQELVIITIVAGPTHADAEALVRDALAALRPPGSASDVLVMVDEETTTLSAGQRA